MGRSRPDPFFKEHTLTGTLSTEFVAFLGCFHIMTCQFLQENLQKWLMDEKARDQFVIRAGFNTEVFWNDARQSKPVLVFNKPVI